MFFFSFIIYTILSLLILFIYKFKTSLNFKRSVIISIITAFCTTITIVILRYLINYLDNNILLSNSEEIGISFIFSITLVRVFIRQLITFIFDNYDFMTIKIIPNVDVDNYKKPILYNVNTSDSHPNFNTQKPNPDFDAMEAWKRMAEAEYPNAKIPDLTPEDMTEGNIKKEWRKVCSNYQLVGNVPPEINGSFSFRNKILLVYSRGSGNNINRIHLAGIIFDPWTENEIKKGYNKHNFAANQPSASIIAELFDFLFINNKRFLGRELLNNSPDMKKYVKDCSPSSIYDHLETGHISKELVNRLRRT